MAAARAAVVEGEAWEGVTAVVAGCAESRVAEEAAGAPSEELSSWQERHARLSFQNHRQQPVWPGRRSSRKWTRRQGRGRRWATWRDQ